MLNQEQEETLVGVFVRATDLHQQSLDELVSSGHIVLTDDQEYGYQLTELGHSVFNDHWSNVW